MTFSAVDIGNTSIKTAVWKDGEMAGAARFSTLAETCAFCREHGAETVAYCTTRTLREEDRAIADNEGWWEFRHGCRLPIDLLYMKPETLGRDRLAAVIAAHERYPDGNVLVADIGTALTLDVVSREGRFLGGNICPGGQMRLDALHKLTSRLPQVDIRGLEPDFGYDTETAMRSGAAIGVVNDVVGTFRMAAAGHGCDTLVVTGGGAQHVIDRIRRFVRLLEGEAVNVELVPTLVLDGLKTAYEYNHDK